MSGRSIEFVSPAHLQAWELLVEHCSNGERSFGVFGHWSVRGVVALFFTAAVLWAVESPARVSLATQFGGLSVPA